MHSALFWAKEEAKGEAVLNAEANQLNLTICWDHIKEMWFLFFKFTFLSL